MNTILHFIQNNSDTVVLIVSLIVAAMQAVRERMKASDAILLMLNTLKDESKMGKEHQTSEELTKKLEAVAKVTDVTKDTLAHVKSVIKDTNRRKGIKIGSYKGKPIYLRDAAQLTPIGGALSNALGVLRGIIRR